MRKTWLVDSICSPILLFFQMYLSRRWRWCINLHRNARGTAPWTVWMHFCVPSLVSRCHSNNVMEGQQSYEPGKVERRRVPEFMPRAGILWHRFNPCSCWHSVSSKQVYWFNCHIQQDSWHPSAGLFALKPSIMREELEGDYEKAPPNISLPSSSPSSPSLTPTGADAPLYEGQAITCVAVCSIAQISLLITWLILFFRLRHASHASGRAGRPHYGAPTVNSPSTSSADDKIFYYRDSTTGDLIVRLDFLVDLAHLLKVLEEPLADDRHHQVAQQKGRD